jgi:hypothetical protein
MLCPAQMLCPTRTIECRFVFAAAFDLLLRLRLPPPFALNVGAELPYVAPGFSPAKMLAFRFGPSS